MTKAEGVALEREIERMRQVITRQEWRIRFQNRELAALREFRDDAIAAYPTLVQSLNDFMENHKNDEHHPEQ